MTAKDTAEQLFIKFYISNVNPNSIEVRRDVAKESALICVDEIRDNLPLISEIQDYWTNVKNEIIKL